MTRTPPDMEIAMSETHTFPLEEIERMERCYELLSALGDPVVVAEALPELVEAALYMRAKRVEHGGGDEEDGIFENDVRCFDAALAKLKARP